MRPNGIRLTHALNVFAGSDPLAAAVQVGYALAIGCGFGAMALKSRLIWPLALAHGLGNFFAFVNGGQVGPQFFIVSGSYILLFSGYGLYLMRPARPTGAHSGRPISASSDMPMEA